MNQETLLVTKSLTKKFGALVAVNNVNLEIKRGLIYAIIGPNGAGKTTLMNLITGVLRPTSGRIYYENIDITDLPAHKRTRLGIGRSFQVPFLYSYMTVLECIRMAVQARYPEIRTKFLSSINDFPELFQESLRILAAVGLYGKTSILVKDLTLSDKRKLEVALALASNPKLLILDEPTAGLSIEEVPVMTRIIKGLSSKDKTILVIEHKMDVVFNIADRIIVMNNGEVIAEGTPREIAENQLVQEVYLGEGALR